MRPTALTYATREMLSDAYDVTELARASKQIDRCLRAATDSVESLCHRVFYPDNRTMTFDFPDWFAPYQTPWILRLDRNEVISVTGVTSGSETITDYMLRPDDGPPFTRIEVDLSSSERFQSGDTHQRAITVAGVFGYQNAEEAAGAVSALTISSATDFAVTDGSLIGVGDLIRIEDEWIVVKDKLFTDTTATTAADIGENDASLTVDDGTLVNAGETILIGAERMLVTAVVGSVVTVLRAWDGSDLDAHTTGAAVYALRLLRTDRGVLGTPASSHPADTAVYRHVPPPLVTSLCLSEAMVQLNAERGGFARKAGLNMDALADLRESVYAEHGRKLRTRAV